MVFWMSGFQKVRDRGEHQDVRIVTAALRRIDQTAGRLGTVSCRFRYANGLE